MFGKGEKSEQTKETQSPLLPRDLSGERYTLSRLFDEKRTFRLLGAEHAETQWGAKIRFRVELTPDKEAVVYAVPTLQRIRIVEYFSRGGGPLYARVKKIGSHYIFVAGDEKDYVPF